MLTSQSIREASSHRAKEIKKAGKSIKFWQVISLSVLAVISVLVALSVGVGAAMFVLPVMAIGTNEVRG